MSHRARSPLHRALSLRHDRVFRLLVVMTALLGWITALGLAGTLMMHQLYREWQMVRERTLMLYLMPDSDTATVANLDNALRALPGITDVATVPAAEVGALLAAYLGEAAGATLPLPQVLRLTLGPGFDRSLLDPVVATHAPTAEVDDARPVMQAVARGVRLVQLAGGILAACMAAIMALLVTLTVQAALRARQDAVQLLQYLGGTPQQVVGLVGAQVLWRVLAGWALAAGAAVAVMLTGALVWPALWPYLTWPVWVALAAGPLLLPLTAWLAARQATLAMLRRRPPREQD